MSQQNEFERFETELAFLSRNLEKMNEVLYEQQQQIDELGKQVIAIREQLKNTSAEIPDQKPPHY